MQHTYRTASEIFSKLLDIEVNAKQIERVCNFYGQKLYSQQCLHDHKKKEGNVVRASTLYVLIDGSFVLIRNSSLKKNEMNFIAGKDAWKEVKLARLINEKHIIKGISKDRSYVSKSEYLVHLGSADVF